MTAGLLGRLFMYNLTNTMLTMAAAVCDIDAFMRRIACCVCIVLSGAWRGARRVLRRQDDCTHQQRLVGSGTAPAVQLRLLLLRQPQAHAACRAPAMYVCVLAGCVRV